MPTDAPKIRRVLRLSPDFHERARYERSSTYRDARRREDRATLALLCLLTFAAGACAMWLLAVGASLNPPS